MSTRYPMVVFYQSPLRQLVFGKVGCVAWVVDVDHGVLVVAQAMVLFVMPYLCGTFFDVLTLSICRFGLPCCNPPPHYHYISINMELKEFS